MVAHKAYRAFSRTIQDTYSKHTMTSMISLNASEWPALVARPALPQRDLPALRDRVAKLENELARLDDEEEELDWELREAELRLKNYVPYRSKCLSRIPLEKQSERNYFMEHVAARHHMTQMEKELARLGHKPTRDAAAKTLRDRPLLPGETVYDRLWQNYLANHHNGEFRQVSGWGVARDEAWESWLAHLEEKKKARRLA